MENGFDYYLSYFGCSDAFDNDHKLYFMVSKEVKRIQRKRTKGWRMPDNTIYVGRPTKFGNPLKLEGDIIYIDAGHRRNILDKWVFLCTGNTEYMLKIYEAILLRNYQYLNSVPAQTPKDLQYWVDKFQGIEFIDELRGKNLSCFCRTDKPCHADILLKYTNQ